MGKEHSNWKWIIIAGCVLIVIVAAFFTWRYFARKTATQTSSNTKEIFKTYKSDEYGFSFAYPEHWNLKDKTTDYKNALLVVHFSEPQRDQQIVRKEEIYPKNIFIRVWPNYENKTLNDWLASRYGGDAQTESADYEPGSPIELGGQKGLISSIGCCAEYDLSYATNYNQLIYEFGTNSYDDRITATKPEVKNLDNRLLIKYVQNFKFIPVKQAPQVSSDSITDKWKTYQDVKYRVTFRYPPDWTTPILTEVKKDPTNPILLFDYDLIDFSGGAKPKYVAVSGYETYVGTPAENDLNKLKNVYLTQDPAGTSGVWLPSSSGAVFSPSTPYYIETYDKKWRGIYYFASIGQTFTTEVDLVAVLTDGIGKVFELQINADSFRKLEFEARNIEKETTKKEFFDYVRSLSNKTNSEPAIKAFNDSYKYILLNLSSY